MARKHPTRLTHLTAVLAALAALGAACSDPVADEPPGQEVSYVTDPAGLCANEGAVVADGALRGEGSLNADVDGDGSDEAVFIVTDVDAEKGCRSFLVVDAGHLVYSAPVDPSGAPRSLPVPTLNSVAPIGGEPGEDIVVNIEMGASTQFVGVFTLGDDGLVRMTVDGKPPGPFAAEFAADALFPFGGSVGHIEAVDCTEDGQVVMSAALPEGAGADEYSIERRFFDPVGVELVLDESLTEREIVRVERIGDFPEFTGSPFAACD